MAHTLFVPLMLTLGAGLATGIGSTIALFAHRTNKRLLSFSLGLSGGVMIYVSFVELFQQAREAIGAIYGPQTGMGITTLAFFGGVLLIGVIDRLVPSVENPHEAHMIEELEKRGKHYYGETFDLAIGVLSKFKPDSWTKCCIVPGDEGRAMVKMVATIEGQPVSFYSCHLDYRHYQCYMPRGYNGTTWKKMDKPITDEEEVLKANRQSFRDETIRAFIQEVQSDIQQGRPIIMGGDFNEPSHLDWQADTKDLWDHNGAIIHWDCSMMLSKAGFKDAYREKFPNTVRYPGFTFPAGNKLAEEAKLEKLAWAPEADERDRIDFIYYYPLESMLSMKDSKLVGPSETVVRGKITENDSKDKILTPSCIWPSDHKGNLATFKIRKKR